MILVAINGPIIAPVARRFIIIIALGIQGDGDEDLVARAVIRTIPCVREVGQRAFRSTRPHILPRMATGGLPHSLLPAVDPSYWARAVCVLT